MASSFLYPPPTHYSTPTHTVCTPPANCAFNPPYPPPSNTQQYSRLIELGRLPIAVAAAAARRGVTVVASSEAYTSMLCSCCRKLHRNLGASITFECPNCGFTTQCVSCAPLALFYMLPFSSTCPFNISRRKTLKTHPNPPPPPFSLSRDRGNAVTNIMALPWVWGVEGRAGLAERLGEEGMGSAADAPVREQWILEGRV